jgi:hypothetical protein
MKQILVASVVILIATTPTWVDAWQIWEHPENFHDGVSEKQIRTMLVAWYVVLVIVALSAWRMFA